MDITKITPRCLKGVVDVPPSKSDAHRAIIGAALSSGESIVSNIAMSEDIKATLNGMRSLGAKYTLSGTTVKIAPKKSGVKKNVEIDCGESGSTLRFLIPIALLSGKNITFTGRGRLFSRPLKPYFDIFDKNGIVYEQTENSLKLFGKLKSGLYSIAGNVSSQFITGLLFALPLLEGDSEIVVATDMESKGYVDMTLKTLKMYGIEIENKNYRRFIIKGGQEYKPVNYTVEGDYSQGAFFLVAGALGCDIEVRGLKEDSLQGDKEIIDIIKRVGGKITKTDNGIKAVRTACMRGITIDVSNIPDLVPIMAVLFAFCEGESRIINARRLRMKESDRLSAVAKELSNLGADIVEGGDYLRIFGKQVLEAKTVSSWNDHRIAMAMAIAACRCEGECVTIMESNAVKKSYPDFFDVYNKL